MALIENPDIVELPPFKGNFLMRVNGVKVPDEEGRSPIMELECIDDQHPEFIGTKLWEFIPTNVGDIENEVARRINTALLFSLGHAFDVDPRAFDSEKLVGAEVRCIVGYRLDKKSGEMRSRVSSYQKA
jgi:hypothetical protein